MADHDLEVEVGDSGSSMTYPTEAGQLKKGDHVLLKGRPTKVVEITTSKTGKHGHAKAHIIGIDIFTGKKYEENSPTTHNMDVPRVAKFEYQVTDVNEGRVSCLDEKGGEVEYSLPSGELGETISSRFEEGADLIVTIITAMGEVQIVSVKDDAKADKN